jgi:hypothetical protein
MTYQQLEQTEKQLRAKTCHLTYKYNHKYRREVSESKFLSCTQASLKLLWSIKPILKAYASMSKMPDAGIEFNEAGLQLMRAL